MPQRSLRQSLGEIAGYTAPPAIHSDEDVWKQVNDDGVDAVAASMSITGRQLLDVLIPEALLQTEKYRPSWIRRHALDVLIVCAVASVAALIPRAQLPQPRIPQVVARHSLAPFQPIRDQDLELSTTPRTTGAFDKVKDVVGRYPLGPVKERSVLAAADLSSGPLAEALQGRTILLLPLKLNKSKLPWGLPAALTLVVSPRSTGPEPLVLGDALVLAFAATGDPPMAYVAVKPEQVPRLAALLASSDVFVAIPAPR